MVDLRLFWSISANVTHAESGGQNGGTFYNLYSLRHK